ncbi:MAG: hypothetical protein FWC61_00575, partial [Proteobacteria bacterium]|nr:hypothetical protein [Pseudomonadota bacterium]
RSFIFPVLSRGFLAVFCIVAMFLGELIFAPTNAHAGPAANVDFVHRYITQKWGITVPIKTSNIYQAVNVKYTLCAVDRANEILNGAPSATTYCNHQLATNQIIDTLAVIDAVDRLVVRDLYPGTGGEGEPFKVTVNASGASATFGFELYAQGNFTIDWGDGTAVQNIVITTYAIPSHTYSAAGNYIVTIGGKATGYLYGYSDMEINFSNSENAKLSIIAISGDLGSVLPALTSVSSGYSPPRFTETFMGLSKLTSIPSNLFAGLHGAPAQHMFFNTFSGCTGLTSIPSGLFAGINGAPTNSMFNQTFYGCTGLTGSVPAGLFGTFTGAPTQDMFNQTFANCTGLTGISDGIWDLSGLSNTSAVRMFNGTFAGCSNITSESPSIAAGSSTKLWTKFSAFTPTAGQGTFAGATKLADYASIPAGWK